MKLAYSSAYAIFVIVFGVVPKLLNFKQKQRRMDIAKEMLTTFNDDSDLLKKVITADES